MVAGGFDMYKKFVSLLTAVLVAVSFIGNAFAVDDPRLYFDSETEFINFIKSEESKQEYTLLSDFYERGFFPIPYDKTGTFSFTGGNVYISTLMKGPGVLSLSFKEPKEYPLQSFLLTIRTVEMSPEEKLEDLLKKEDEEYYSSVVQRIEVYKGREIASWDIDEEKDTFSTCVFTHGKYLIKITALGTLREEPWKNEYLDLFEFKHIELPGNVSAESDLYYGDIDRDGRITPVDALFALQLSVPHFGKYPVPEPNPFISYKEPESEFKLIGDANKDNMIGVSDALMILQYAVGKISAF